MTNFGGYDGVIFDLDGTLVDSLEDIAVSMNAILHNFSYPVHAVDAYKLFIGKGIHRLVIAALPEDNRDEHTVEKCEKLMREVYNYNCLNKTKVYDGIIDLLNGLTSRGIKLGVLSNKGDMFTNKIVRALLPDCFDIVIGMDSDAHKKPNPLGAIHISVKLGIAPGNMAIIGDSAIDMQMAKNAGMHGVGVMWGYGSREELTASGAERMLNYPGDLLDVL